MTIDLRRSYDIEPGEEISIEVIGIDSLEIAIQNLQGPRGFALDVRVLDGQGGADGPVETRYTLDPNASARTATATTTATSEPTSNAGGTTTMGDQSSATTGPARTTAAPSANETTEEGTETTSTTGPGFGIVAAIVALLAATLPRTDRN
jgi:PGF-CTERM protein